MTIFSPSGKVKLWINPGDPMGKGPSNCRLTIDGKVAWHKNLTFTFHEAKVADSGLVGGYAYTEGEMRLGEFVVALIDPTGKIVLQDRAKRQNSRFLHTDPDPKASDIILDPPNDRMVVRVDNADLNVGTETWQVYKLSSRKRLENLYPEGKSRTMGQSVHQAMPLPGTPLLVTNWYHFTNDRMGQYFTLVDPKAKELWRLNLPGDYESGATGERAFDVRDEAMRTGTILGTPKPRRFEVRFVKESKRVTFEANFVDGKWTVKEVSRKPFKLQVPAKQGPLKVRSANFTVSQTLRLPKVSSVKSEIDGVWEFDFFGNDQVAFLRRDDTWEFCTSNLSGKITKRVPLPKEAQADEGELFLTKISGAKFMVIFSLAGKNDKSRAWTVDAISGKFRTLPMFSSYWVQSVAAFPDGRFAVISTESVPFSQVDHLTLHKADGTRIWDKSEHGYGGTVEEMLSPEDIAIDAKGRIVILDVIRHTIQFFKADGKFDGVINLDKKWGKEASYPTQITCLPDGRFWLLDSAEKPCMYLGSSGEILREFKPSYPSGKSFDTFGAIRVDRKGQPWVTNQDSIHRLDSKGVSVQTLGSPERLSGLDSVAKLHIASDGKVYARDKATSAVHVFDSKGAALFIAKPAPTEFEDSFLGPFLEVTRSGDIFISGTKKGGYLHYSPTGKRIGHVAWKSFGREDATGPLPPLKIKPSWRWSGSDLVDEKERVMGVMRRWPDQAWMGGPAATAPDGTMMSFEGNDWRDPKGGTRRLAFFKANGLPLSQSTLPLGMPETNGSAYDGTLCYFVTEKGLIAVNRFGKAIWSYRPKGWDTSWEVFPSLGKLALYDGERTVTWIKPSG